MLSLSRFFGFDGFDGFDFLRRVMAALRWKNLKPSNIRRKSINWLSVYSRDKAIDTFALEKHPSLGFFGTFKASSDFHFLTGRLLLEL